MAMLSNNVLTVEIARSPEYSMEDLRSLVDEFKKSTAKVPMSMVSSEAVAFMGQRGGSPALGWLANLWLDGSRLMGSFDDVPKSLLPKFAGAGLTIWPEIKGGRIIRVTVKGLDLPRPRSLEEFSVALLSDTVTVKTFSQGDDDDLMSVDRLTRTRMSRTGESYADAVRETLADFPEIARGYLCRRPK